MKRLGHAWSIHEMSANKLPHQGACGYGRQDAEPD
jgi:hypothetical protein